jgi:hypothetical protein
MSNLYQRESVEYQPVIVTVDGTVRTAGVTLAIVEDGERPVDDDFDAPTVIGTEIGVMVDGLAVGAWHVFAKIVDTPEVPVVDCGVFHVI